MGTGVPPSHKVLTQVASSEGVSPTDLEPPLHDVVDPDALDRLVESCGCAASDRVVTIEFPYRGYMVRVDSTGAVDLTVGDQLPDSTGDSTEESHGD
ncbi:HalOD1 output domain-containing protein [Natronorubrum sp. DTA7]|uniref:HalOD1 output domain-containing protein n=1 Tax=Natronorubrum sp. DTA7 TaxID=3447016 RepID=UPI003F84710D